MITMDKVLQMYSSPGNPQAFSGITNLKRKFKSKDITKALESTDSYTIKREAKKPKYYNPYYVWDKRKHIQIDLIDYASPKLKKIAAANKNFKYLFCAIDGFSRYAWVIPMKNKKEDTCVVTFNKLLDQMGETPKRVVSDRGSEFISKKFISNLEEKKIRPIHVNFKAGIVERFQRSLQSLIAKYQKFYNTLNFVDVLPKLLETYNSRYHRTIKMAPRDAEIDTNKNKVRLALKKYYLKATPGKKKIPKFEIGDKVRVQKQKSSFARGYDDVFSDEIYNISKINTTLPVPMYSLTSFDGQMQILANFYENELQKISGSPFKIIQILKEEKHPSGLERAYVELNVNNETLFAWVNKKDL